MQKEDLPEKVTYQIVRKVNGRVADDIIYIKDHQVQTLLGSAPVPNLFSYLCRVTGYDIFPL